MGRIRHESVGEQSPKTSDRENRFPSPKVGSDQFLRIVSWQEPAESEHRTSPTPSSDIAGEWKHFIDEKERGSERLVCWEMELGRENRERQVRIKAKRREEDEKGNKEIELNR